jgi:nitrilase
MRLAVVQMNSGANPERNLETLAGLVEQAADAGAELAVLPENFALMSEDSRQRSALAEQAGAGPIQSAVANLARRHGVWLVAGTIPVRGPDPARPFATCFVYGADGVQVARYDKIHLFDVDLPDGRSAYRESGYTTPGSLPVVIDTPWGRLGIGVCYDLRFPELFRALGTGGLDLIALPAAFTVTTGRAHWESLLRARAIENQSFVAAAAQTGSHSGGRATWGHSLILDGWGRKLADLGDTIGVACVDADMNSLADMRRRFPSLAHRRPELFAGKSPGPTHE